jgi:hypothetical protein
VSGLLVDEDLLGDAVVDGEAGFMYREVSWLFAAASFKENQNQ